MSDIAFIVNVFQDEPFAVDLIRQIRAHYPGSEILVICDGPADPWFRRKCLAYKLNYYEGGRLKDRSSCEWSIRMFSLAAELEADVIIKIDPDCVLNNPIQLPDVFDVAASTRGQTVLGGCIAFRHEVVKRLHEFSQNYKGEVYYGSRSTFMQPLHSQDRLINAAIKELHLKLQCLPNGGVNWAYPPLNPETFDVIHPRLDSIPLLGQSCFLGRKQVSPVIHKQAQQFWEAHKARVSYR